MKDGSKKISCIGIVGDGCGGGREFIVENEILFAHDPQTNEDITLLENVIDAYSISKKACILTIECKDDNFQFDLSLMKKI